MNRLGLCSIESCTTAAVDVVIVRSIPDPDLPEVRANAERINRLGVPLCQPVCRPLEDHPLPTVDDELADELETIHYRLAVSRTPDAALIAIARLLEAIPEWLAEVAAEEPAMRWGVARITRRQWDDAATALSDAGSSLFRQLQLGEAVLA